MSQSLCINLVYQENDKFFVNDKAIDWLCTLQGPLMPVCIVGGARTGKSFIFNRVACQNANSGFAVGSTTNSCTRGLWVSKTVQTTSKGTVIYIDTEGIDHAGSNSAADSKIFALGLLLCSQLCYNSSGTIDESAVSTLAMVADVCERITSGTGPAQEPHFPRLVWLLRDMTLSLRSSKDPDKNITADEYLEDVLSIDESRNCASRKAITTSFVKRSCFTFERPVANESALNSVEQRPSSIKKSFTNKVKLLREDLKEHACPLVGSNGMAVQTSGQYAALCRAMVDAVNDSEGGYNLFEVWKKVQAVEKQSRMNDFSHQANQSRGFGHIVDLLQQQITDCASSSQLTWQEKSELAEEMACMAKDIFVKHNKAQQKQIRSLGQKSPAQASISVFDSMGYLGFVTLQDALPVVKTMCKKQSGDNKKLIKKIELENQTLQKQLEKQTETIKDLEKREIELVNVNAELQAQTQMQAKELDTKNEAESTANGFEIEKLEAEINEARHTIEKEKSSKENLKRALLLLQEQHKKIKEKLQECMSENSLLEAKNDQAAENARLMQQFGDQLKQLLGECMNDALKQQKTHFENVSAIKESIHEHHVARTRAEATLNTERKILKRTHDDMVASLESERKRSRTLMAENARVLAKVSCLEVSYEDAAKTNEQLLKALVSE